MSAAIFLCLTFMFLNEEQFENTFTPVRYRVEDSSCAFILRKNANWEDANLEFYNFYYRNNRWNELKINDLLQIQGNNRWKMNDLITKKVKALKDQQIDCSNVVAFTKTAENRWMLTQTGIDFCSQSSENSSKIVVVAFTWSELSPFLKLKIY